MSDLRVYFGQMSSTFLENKIGHIRVVKMSEKRDDRSGYNDNEEEKFSFYQNRFLLVLIDLFQYSIISFNMSDILLYMISHFVIWCQ